MLRTFGRESLVLNLHVGGKVIGTTHEHPFFVKAKGWTNAHELHIGDEIRLMDAGWTKVEGVADAGQLTTVYNMEVEDDHTYFVGGTDWGWAVWAHNAYKVSKAVRDSAISAAWQQEADLVRRTGQGTRNWTAKQKQQLLDTGKVRGYLGHHISSVNDSPLLAGLPDNIQFLTFRQHYRIHNNGRYQIPVYGNLLSR